MRLDVEEKQLNFERERCFPFTLAGSPLCYHVTLYTSEDQWLDDEPDGYAPYALIGSLPVPRSS